MKKTIKIIFLSCSAFLILNLVPLIVWVAITQATKLPYWWELVLSCCVTVIMACGFVWAFLYRKEIKKELSEIVNTN